MSIFFAAIATIIAFVNIFYLLNKDCISKGEAEILECLKTIKQSLDDISKNKNTPNNTINIDVIIANIENLVYLRLIKENEMQDDILKLSVSIYDYIEGTKDIESTMGVYKGLIEKLYNAKISLKKYLFYTFPFIETQICRYKNV